MLSNLAATLAVIAFGTLTGLHDLQSQEVQGMAVMIFMFACLVGAAFPDGAWRRALVLGLSVPFAHWVAQTTGQTLPYPMPDLATAFLAIVPALVGTLLGVGLRRAWTSEQQKRRGA